MQWGRSTEHAAPLGEDRLDVKLSQASTNQGDVFTAGLALFVLSVSLGAYQIVLDPAGNPDNTSKKNDPGDIAALLSGIAQTMGLLVMTLPNLDANRYLAQHLARLLSILVIWAVSYFVLVRFPEQYSGIMYIPALLPFAYITLRFDEVIQMTGTCPPLTQLFTLILALDLLGYGGVWFFTHLLIAGLPLPKLPWPSIIICVLGPGGILYAYSWSRRRRESHSISFQTAIYTYLFLFGTAILCGCLWDHFVNHAQHKLGGWLVGPIHFVPTLTMLVFRTSVFKWLGLRWLSHQDANSLQMTRFAVMQEGGYQ
jgi:hypothetical protein